MTKKDFKLIAAIIASLQFDRPTREGIARDFARALKLTNPRFDVDRFVEACLELPR